MFRITRSLIVTACLLAAPLYGCSPVSFAQTGAGQAAAAQPRTSEQSPSTSALPNRNGSVKFAVIGDTGTGDRQQYEIGKLLNDARSGFPYEFVIMLGDNMYGGEGPSDFVKKFETPYKSILDAGIKFYATLGNHDDPAQRFYKPFNMDGKRYYTFRKDDVEFFVLDSTYMSPAQVDWLKEALTRSDAKWKIPYMHHPLYSSGEKHGSEEDLRTLIEPLFVDNGVDVVFAGHEHFYERLNPQHGIYYFTEGGSAKLRRGNLRVGSTLTAKGFDTDRSFMLVEIAGDEMFFETISRVGRVVDSGSLPRREVTSRETK